jgi:TATA-binding protein-associated factor Taf7
LRIWPRAVAPKTAEDAEDDADDGDQEADGNADDAEHERRRRHPVLAAAVADRRGVGIER